MFKKVVIGCLLTSGVVMSANAMADNHTVSLGYSQSKVQDFKNIRGVNAQYRYEWDLPVSVIGSFTYMNGDDSGSYYDSAGDFYKNNLDVKYTSLLAGPAYRFNEYISLYGLAGIAVLKVDGGYEWRNSVGAEEPGGHETGSVSKKSANFAYAVGFTVNPAENVSVNVGYEGTKVDLDGSHSINGFNISAGYRF